MRAKTTLKRLILLLVLFTCAVTWAYLMSVNFWRRQPTSASGGYVAEVTYVDQAGFPEITAYVSVVDGSGQMVKDLDVSDFSVFEDGRGVDVTDFVGGGAQPVTAVMLIDRSGSMQDGTKMADAIAAALEFLGNLKNGRDRLGVVAFGDAITVVGDLQLMDSSVRADLQAWISGLQPRGDTAYYDTIHKAVGMLEGVSGRKVVLALTDGEDNMSSRSMSTVIDYALEGNIAIYTIGLGYNVQSRLLQQMAERTGGKYYEEPSGSELAQLYADIAQSLQDEYSLTYTSPTQRLDGTTRQVEVSVQLSSGAATGVGSYAVGGTLTPSLSMWPCLGVFPLLVLLALPTVYDLVRGRGRLAEPEATPVPASAMSAAPPPEPRPAVSPPAPAAPAAVCPSCGAALRAGAHFCGVCGKLTAARTPPEPVCARCGAPLRPGAKFCRACGQSAAAVLEQRACPHCGAVLKPTARFCAKCGHGV